MSIKLTVEQALDAYTSCNELIKKSFSAKTAIRLIRLQKELEIPYQAFNKAKDDTIIKYSIKDENGETKVENLEDGRSFVLIGLENREICAKELNEALAQEIEVSDIYFNEEDFGDEKISAEYLIGLLPFIK